MSLPHYRGPAKPSDMHRSGAHSGGSNQRIEEVNQHLLEQQNEQRWEELGAQVNLLKSLSIDINAEVRDQNSMLDGMGSSLGQTTDLLTSTIGKIGVMVSSGGSKHMCYLVLFVVVFFMMLYFMMRK